MYGKGGHQFPGMETGYITFITQYIYLPYFPFVRQCNRMKYEIHETYPAKKTADMLNPQRLVRSHRISAVNSCNNNNNTRCLYFL